MQSAAYTKERDRDLWFSALLFLLALVPRLYVALAWSREPVWDGHYYDFGARRIAMGLGYSDDIVIGGHTVWHPWCHYPVGYSGFLAFFYWIFGPGPHVGPIVNAIVGALTCVLVHRLALFATSRTRAQVAGVLTAVHPGLIAYSALLMTEPLAAFGLILAAWLFIRDRERPLRAGIVSGIVIGLSTLVRPPSILLAPALFFLAPSWISRRNGDSGSPQSKPTTFYARAAGPIVACVLAVVTVLPWTFRNCRVMDGCAFVSTNAGWNLMIGAFPRATGRFETVRATDGCPVVTGQVQQDRCWGEAGIAHILEDPARYVSLVPKKLEYTFNHESFPMGYLGEASPTDWPEARKAEGRWLFSVAHGALLSIAALAAVPFPTLSRTRKNLYAWIAVLVVAFLVYRGIASDDHPIWPLAIAAVQLPFVSLWRRDRGGFGPLEYCAFLLGTVALVSAIFFGEDRYHIVASPAICLLAAMALRGPTSDRSTTS